MRVYRHLTPVDLKILDLAAREGLTTREIAVKLGRSESAIRSLWTGILWKFGARRMAHAVYLAIKDGHLKIGGGFPALFDSKEKSIPRGA